MAADSPAWGSVLQDKFVGAHAVACCPSMDLVAVLTEDRQLLVHRTISWQRVVHVRPSEVLFTMETLAWSPDGMRLAVGCNEGEVVVFSMASAGDDKGTEIKPHTDNDELRHEANIVAMHWVQLRDSIGPRFVVPPSSVLRNRPPTFSVQPRPVRKGKEEASVLVTSDQAGRVGFWWNGLVLVAMVPLRDRWFAIQNQSSTGVAGNSFTIHAAMVTEDLSSLLVDISSSMGCTSERSRVRTVLQVDLSQSLQDVRYDLSVMSRVGFDVRSSLTMTQSTLRQIASEWINATRGFEAKMAQLGALYKQYANHVTPQVDMLAIIAGGVASPALAQFFAQNIQEPNFIRMQKTFFSGCDTIQNLSSSKIKHNLQRTLFDIAELRGTVKWNHRAFSDTLGISTAELDFAIENIGNLIATLEQFEILLMETRHNFAQLFSWLLEQMKIHTNDVTSRPAAGTTRLPDSTSKSLLNIRRLATFFEHAVKSAKDFREQQQDEWLMEATFGNEISKAFASSKLMMEVTALDTQWSGIMNRMVRALSLSVGLSRLHPIDLGRDVDEVRLHTRWMARPHSDSDEEDQEMGDDDDSSDCDSVEFNVLEAVDWNSLESLRVSEEGSRDNSYQLVIVARRGHCFTFLTTSGGPITFKWSKRVVDFGMLCGGDDTCSSVHYTSLYGGIHSGKQEQLVVTDMGGIERMKIYMVDYDSSFRNLYQARDKSTSAHKVSTKRCWVKRREVPLNKSSAVVFTKTTTVTQATRGIVCVNIGGSRLVIFDAEDDPEEDTESEDFEGRQKTSGDFEDREEIDL